MVYMGSKARYAKELLPIILQGRKPGQYYVEPFCGGCNMIDKVDGPRIANDSNHYLIALFKYLQDGGKLPEHVTEQEYKAIKADPYLFDDWLVAFAGFLYSFRGKWFGGYGKSEIGRKQAKSQVGNLVKQTCFLKNIQFSSVSYLSLSIPPNSIVYCDPPYAGTTGYKDKFDSDIFWNWARQKQDEGHWVYVSEYNAPDDFLCLWHREVRASSIGGTNKPATERLFI